MSFTGNLIAQNTIPLKAGTIIRKSATIKPGIYKLSSTSMENGVILIEGDNITVDFNGAVLQGFSQTTTPDQYTGIGLQLKGSNITIKNAVIKGYKVGLIARNCAFLKISYCDLSYNYKQHLRSTLEREDVSDWMSYHSNKNDEWLRYGAGIYLSNCTQAQVSHCTITGGQNGLMLTGCEEGTFWNNNFSFLSGIGIGMYRSSRNKIMHNKLDWCVRGYSHGVYQRGQDSAAILVYEQSSENTFAYNSATHSGDGFFLWAGQYTMDTGDGGCNDNLLYGNDFSHAPTNGVEITFSLNKVINNRIEECTHGIWGGYSFNTLILGNQFAGNKYAIAIEHGQENSIGYNTFENDTTGIWLFSRKSQPKDWGYAQKRDTRSREYTIAGNQFNHTPAPLLINGTREILIEHNTFNYFTTLLKSDSMLNELNLVSNNLADFDAKNIQASAASKNIINERNFLNPVSGKLKSAPVAFADTIGKGILETVLQKEAPDSLPGGINPMLKPAQLRGRKYILVGEWGPYDFKSPVLWPRKRNTNGNWEFELLGPAGKWKLKKQKGIMLSATSGNIPGTLTAQVDKDSLVDIDVELEYTGAAIITTFGEKIAAGKPYVFHFRKFAVPMQWNVQWYKYDKSTDPQAKPEAFQKLLKSKKLFKSEQTKNLAYDWYGSFGKDMPSDSVATVAEGTFTVPKGHYTLHVTSDDGVRIWLDGKKVIDHWKPHEPEYDSVSLPLHGTHQLRIEHYEIGGFATLVFGLKPDEEVQ
ncbi:hypothetical protein GXP67_18805 [Rhodocytophaga rosea]|uniref:PA14 domain-containing protein n=1 Tax=Rhodocytophaga rosea TaxID=2704465 RepID=A0A6C0GKS1_9BACT|nr:right-handed parallel beta-helix repeat-containing protein [Rhodocytophaga rosea]QHT68547.1 hypothetical protein GXP67_18805 [Rhodocytophaga rosea]